MESHFFTTRKFSKQATGKFTLRKLLKVSEWKANSVSIGTQSQLKKRFVAYSIDDLIGVVEKRKLTTRKWLYYLIGRVWDNDLVEEFKVGSAKFLLVARSGFNARWISSLLSVVCNSYFVVVKRLV